MAEPNDAQAELDGVLRVMFAQAANQALLSDLGIHVFKDTDLILVGALQSALIRRPSAKTWPPPMLRVDYRLAA